MKNRIISFRIQRVIFTLIILGIAFAWTTSVLWGHIETVVKPDYQLLAKAGLLLLPIVALIMTVWELFVDDVKARRHPSHETVIRLVNWCFYGAYILMAAEIVHSGAVLKYEQSINQQTANVKTAAEAQAIIEARRIEATGKAAAELNRQGQRQSARRMLAEGSKSASGGKEIIDQTQHITGATFLPTWYIGGGMYVALPLLAVLFFALTMFFARQAQGFVDADDDGIPDARQKIGIEQEIDAGGPTGTLETHRAPMLSPPVRGFHRRPMTATASAPDASKNADEAGKS